MRSNHIAICLAVFNSLAMFAHAGDSNPATVFEQRIVPIFRSPNPSSCVQCHLSSVDLKDYIRPSSRETFLSLRDQGLVDVQKPSESKILHLISMGESDPDSMAKRIHAKNRKAEYEAFAVWIEACCQDTELVGAASLTTESEVGPSKSDAIIRHTRKDRVLDSFVRNIWSQRMRCFPCHTPGELDAENPMHKKPIQRYKEFIAKFGGRMNVFKETPEETLRSLVASSRKRHGDDLPLINTENPLQSLLLVKPTSRVPAKDESGKLEKPSSAIPVTHLGGIKMHKDDHSYKAFAAWLTDYTISASGGYESTEALPSDNWYPTEHVMRIKGLPSEWPNLSTVQIFVHQWDAKLEDWSPQPVAFTQTKVTPRKIINGSLFLIARDKQRDSLSSDGEVLSPSKVLLKIYLDKDEIIQDHPTRLLNKESVDATAIVEAKFGKGFKNADVVEGNQLKFPH